MATVSPLPHAAPAAPRAISEREWMQMREQLVQFVSASDGEYEHKFRCETPAELWRARTLSTKEAGTVQWIRNEVHAGDVFYDVGANIGLYTLMAGRRVGQAGAVYAFEPHVGNVQSLLANVALNALAGVVQVFSCALNDHEGFFDFNYRQSGAGSSMSQLNDVRDAEGNQFQPVYAERKYATTIDRLLETAAIRPPHHIKIDVDGNEMLILRGMQRLLASSDAPRTVQIEINTRYKQELFDFLRGRGYVLAERHDTHHGQEAIRRGQDPEAIGYNMIFRKPRAS